MHQSQQLSTMTGLAVAALSQAKVTVGFAWVDYHQLHFVEGFVSIIIVMAVELCSAAKAHNFTYCCSF